MRIVLPVSDCRTAGETYHPPIRVAEARHIADTDSGAQFRPVEAGDGNTVRVGAVVICYYGKMIDVGYRPRGGPTKVPALRWRR